MTLGIGKKTCLNTRAKTGQTGEGFTLVEVLVALLILVSVLTLCAVAFSRHLAAVGSLESSLQAHRLADAQMIQVIRHRALAESIPAEGEAGGFRWRLEPPVASPQLEGMTQEKVQVFWVDRSKNRTLALEAALVSDGP